MKSVARAEPTPSVIRGESPTGEVLIDTLSVTMPIRCIEALVGSVSGWTESNEQIVAAFQRFLIMLFGSGVFEITDIKGGRNFFDNSLPFDNNGGFIAWGGNNKVINFDGETKREVEERLQLYLTGEGCLRVINWPRLHAKLQQLEARITRLDIAFDSHSGAYSIEDCLRWLHKGLFKGQGRPPNAKYISDMGSDQGCTLYVGDRANGKMFRGYDKGKQLGDPASPWFRMEIELHAKDRVIPLDALLDPAKYLAGSYKALQFISEVVQQIKTARLKLDIQFTKLMRIARVQYGKLLHYANRHVGLSEEQVFIDLRNSDGYPDRLKWSIKLT